jgi:ketosteroid isomerase-like protein
MSQANVEIVRRWFEAAAREDWVAAEEMVDPGCELHDLDMPDADGYRGHKGFFDWIAAWDDAWDSWEMTELEIKPLADERVIAFFTMSAKGLGSGIELKRRDAMIYTLSGGKITWLEYLQRAAAALGARSRRPTCALGELSRSRLRRLTIRVDLEPNYLVVEETDDVEAPVLDQEPATASTSAHGDLCGDDLARRARIPRCPVCPSWARYCRA